MKTIFLIRLGVLLGLAVTLSSGGCGESAGPASADFGTGSDGQAGSTARFALMGNTLYAVDNASLRTFDLSNPQTPTPGPVVNVGFGVETIFPQAPYLFIGSQQGMYIYNTASGSPQLVGTYTHAVSCDPVVVADRYAYVTLRNDGPCARGLNQLDVVDLANLTRPQLAKSYPLSQPYGLGVDSSMVFVCDKGIKVFDARNTPTLREVQSFSIAATDVIARKGVLLVTGSDGLYQYRYTAATGTGAGTLQQLSRIPVTPPKP
jgi:hypothetical protein